MCQLSNTTALRQQSCVNYFLTFDSRFFWTVAQATVTRFSPFRSPDFQGERIAADFAGRRYSPAIHCTM